MKQIIHNGVVFKRYNYQLEKELENDVITNSEGVFGKNGIYIDIKKRIGKKGIAGIPDGYYLDLKYHEAPSIYIVEHELAVHDTFTHVAEQMFRFATNIQIEDEKIKLHKILVNELSKEQYSSKLNTYFASSNQIKNIDSLITHVVFHSEINAIIVIDEKNEILNKAISQIRMHTDVLEFSCYVNEQDKIYIYDTFEGELVQKEEKAFVKNKRYISVDYDSYDTIVVPAQEEGFKEVFIKKNCWYAIRIANSKIRSNKLKYIAAYQTKPVSAITYVAEISSISEYRDPTTGEPTNKYIVYFKGPAQRLTNPVVLPKSKPQSAPQGSIYTTYDSLLKAKTIEELS